MCVELELSNQKHDSFTHFFRRYFASITHPGDVLRGQQGDYGFSFLAVGVSETCKNTEVILVHIDEHRIEHLRNLC